MNPTKIPWEKYAKEFSYTKSQADQISKQAMDACMKYVGITSKHHGGFELFDSKFSEYQIIDN